jgi:drug/metabolite transporter (DMT)-like permease
MRTNNYKPIILGTASSLLFSVTFIVNRLMSLSGGSWVWSSALRFYWMLPFFFMIVWSKGGLKELFIVIKMDLLQWFIWSTVGFGLFYASLTFAAAYSPAWLLASTWQVTIVAGIIIAPLISKHITAFQSGYSSTILFSLIILLGIIVMQISHAQIISSDLLLKGVLPALVAAFAYPLGNRQVMQLTNGRLDVYQRILGMVICSLPFWFVLSSCEMFIAESYPLKGQYLQTLIVAIFSGVMATSLFFFATDSVRNNEKKLAAVEATQSTEVLFALAGEIIILNSPLPDVYSLLGICLVMLGMVLHSLRG